MSPPFTRLVRGLSRFRYVVSSSIAVAALLLPLWSGVAGSSAAFDSGPPTEKTGAPGETTCRDCHSSFALNSGGGTLSIQGLPAKYTPNKSYDLMVTIALSGAKRWGFELSTRKDGTKDRGGDLAISDKSLTKFLSNPAAPKLQYISHTSAGTRNGTLDGPVDFPFQWTAPAAGTGPVTFYLAGNAANGNSSSSGDHIYTFQAPLEEETAATLLGDLNGDGTVNIADATLSLQIAVGVLTPTDAQAAVADVNGDGKINIQDATTILRKAVGIEV